MTQRVPEYIDPSEDDGWTLLPRGSIIILLGVDILNASFYHALAPGVGFCRISVCRHPAYGITLL